MKEKKNVLCIGVVEICNAKVFKVQPHTLIRTY